MMALVLGACGPLVATVHQSWGTGKYQIFYCISRHLGIFYRNTLIFNRFYRYCKSTSFKKQAKPVIYLILPHRSSNGEKQVSHCQKNPPNFRNLQKKNSTAKEPLGRSTVNNEDLRK